MVFALLFQHLFGPVQIGGLLNVLLSKEIISVSCLYLTELQFLTTSQEAGRAFYPVPVCFLESQPYFSFLCLL